MAKIVWLIVGLGVVFGMMIALAHTDVDTVQTPPLTPVTRMDMPWYGDRG